MNFHVELDRLRAENAALREELAAWRQHDAFEVRADAKVQAFTALRRALAMRPTAARMVLAMCARPGRNFSRDDLLIYCNRDYDRYADASKIVDVQLCFARKALKAKGLGGAIQTVWCGGWSIDAENAQRILALAAPEQGRAAA